jgi:hypothetical protein
MKSHLLKSIIVVVFIVPILLFTSCEDEECKSCKKVTYENGTKINESEAETFCDAELEAKMLETAVTIGDKSIKWECK